MQSEALVKSRPVYQAVKKNDHSIWHLFIVAGEMLPDVKEIFDHCKETERDVISVSDISDAQTRIKQAAPLLPLSTTVYVAGSEPFMWAISESLTSVGMLAEQIQLFSPVDKSRQVFCCHCYHISSGIKQNPAKCAGCQRLLEVTDHFSRKHGAYFAYQVNAEDPSYIPEPEVLS